MRLTDAQVEEIFDELGLPEDGRRIVRQVRAGRPERRVGRKSVSGRYPSVKMGMTIQSESRSEEGVGCLLYEHDPEVREYYDQPYEVVFPHASLGSAHATAKTIPDFLVISRRFDPRGGWKWDIGFEEWRKAKRMEKLAAEDPTRYVRGADGTWDQPPASRYLRERGLGYRIRSANELPETFVRNHDLLDDFFLATKVVDAGVRSKVRAFVEATPGVTLAGALAEVPGVCVDDLFALIVDGTIWTDLTTSLLSDHQDVRLYADEDLGRRLGGKDQTFESAEVALEKGTKLLFVGTEYEIEAITDEHVFLHSEGGKSRKYATADIERYIADGDITGVMDVRDAISDALAAVDQKHMVRGQERVEAIEDAKERGISLNRSQRRWMQRMVTAEGVYGSGFPGAVPQFDKSGNREPRLDEAVELLAVEVIRKQVLSPEQRSGRAAHRIYKELCRQRGIKPMSLQTFSKRIKVIPNEEYMRARWGAKAAHSAAMRLPSDGALPKHGLYPFARVHVDHTELPVRLVDSITGDVIGNAWLTLAIDAYSGRVIAYVLLFEKPSSRSLLVLLREIVAKWGRLPTTFVLDFGAEFESAYFEALVAAYKSKIEHRPVGEARFGGPVEGSNKKMMDDLIWNLRGNTQSLQKPRQLSETHNPDRHAVWTLAALHAEIQRWLEIFEKEILPRIGDTPLRFFEAGLAASGARAHKRIALNETFRALTALPTKNGNRVKVRRDGVRVNHLTYWCEAFRDEGVEGSSVEVRSEAFDARVVHVRVGKKWCVATADHPQLRGRTATEVMIASQELRKRIGSPPSIDEIAKHLIEIQKKEEELAGNRQDAQQRRRAEQRALLETVEPTPQAALDAQPAANPQDPPDEIEIADTEGYEVPTADEFDQLVRDTIDEVAA